MKTKAYSKEGLSASAKLDPREQARMEASDFLNEMVAELETQIEALEAEGEQLQATMKKGKGHSAKAERMATIEHIIERHKWHQGKLELIRRSLENGGVEPDQVTDLEESIRYYVTDGQNDDFNEDEELYDDLALEDEEEQYGMNTENDKGSSQDTQSVQDEPEPEPTTRPGSIPGGKSRPTVDQAGSTGRRPSTQLKSPLPTLATVNTTPLPTMASNVPASTVMKPAAVPTRPAGEGLKYASAAAAAAAADKAGVGIAPLPPPPGAPAGAPSSSQAKTSTTTTSSPSTASIQLASQAQAASLQQQRAQDTDRYVTPAEAAAASIPAAAAPAQAIVKKADREATAAKASSSKSKTATPSASSTPSTAAAQPSAKSSSRAAQTNGISKAGRNPDQHQEEESVYHLPAALQDLVESFETTKKRGPAPLNNPRTSRLLTTSLAAAPSTTDAEPHKLYRPDQPLPYSSVLSHYPQEPLPIFDNPQLYSRIDPDTLFYVFYYKQGTYQQFLAAKALKDQSWRFHKQYQTWFQRHEEPKAITEEYEQGTYRFFDYESTW